MGRENLLKFIKEVSTETQINNINDATISSVNVDGTFDIRLASGAIKRKAMNMRQDLDLKIGDVVNISFIGNAKETAKILGRSVKRKGVQKVITV